MRADQYEKLQDLATKIADVAIFDADPANWIGANTAAKDLTKDERGDAYWCRKLAVSSLSVLLRVQSVIGQIELQGSKGKIPIEQPEEDTGLDGEIRAAERKANELLEGIANRAAARSKFEQRTVGK